MVTVDAPAPAAAIDTAAWAAAEALATIAAHAAWHAANARSLLWAASAADLKKMEAANLEALLPLSTARAIRKLALSAAWYASNTRRLLLLDAARDYRRYRESLALLATILPPDLTQALETLTISAAWHAANTRSMLWIDAERDVQRFEECCRRLPTLLQRSGVCCVRADGASPPPPAAFTHGFSPLRYSPDGTPPGAGSPAGSKDALPASPPVAAGPCYDYVPRTGSTLTRSSRAALQRTHCVLDDVIPPWKACASCQTGGAFS